MATRTRRNVWNPAPGENTLAWYAKAVEAMKKRDLDDPLSWRYQAAIHDYTRAEDPLADPKDKVPSKAAIKRFWSKCQHTSYFFLPWHRMYLHHFERIVAKHVADLKGPKDWALPYWNYSASDASRLLPPAFRDSTSPLFVADRDPAANAGQQFADARDADISIALAETVFTGPADGGSSSFGGPPVSSHGGGDVVGTLEAVPHGSMHVEVGGWMGAFNTAALDPIFWLHHANIDRLWEAWLKDPKHTNPATAAWLSSTTFEFHNAAGNAVKMKCSQVLKTASAPLSYVYDDLSGAGVGLSIPGATMKKGSKAKKPPEMVGASTTGLVLGNALTSAVVPLAAKAATAIAPVGAKATGKPRRAFLNLENVTSAQRAPAYDVYVNLPEGADPRQHEDHFAGRLPMFGVREASLASASHSGSGLSYVLDVTTLFQRQSAQGWTPENLKVSFVPVRGEAKAPVRVGRVSLYLE